MTIGMKILSVKQINPDAKSSKLINFLLRNLYLLSIFEVYPSSFLPPKVFCQDLVVFVFSLIYFQLFPPVNFPYFQAGNLTNGFFSPISLSFAFLFFILLTKKVFMFIYLFHFRVTHILF